MNTHKQLALFSFFFLISFNHAFSSPLFRTINLTPVISASPKTPDSSSPSLSPSPTTTPASSGSPPTPNHQNPFHVPKPDVNGQHPTWDDVVDMVARNVFVTVRDLLKGYENIHKCGPVRGETPGVISTSPPSPISQTPPPSPSPSPVDAPSPTPSPSDTPSPNPSPSDAPSSSPAVDAPSPTPSPSDTPSLNPSPSDAPSSSPVDHPHPPYHHHLSPNAPAPTSPSSPPDPSPTCVIKHRCKCECDGIVYRGYSCDVRKPCWCNCVSKRTVNSEPLIPIKTEKRGQLVN